MKVNIWYRCKGCEHQLSIQDETQASETLRFGLCPSCLLKTDKPAFPFAIRSTGRELSEAVREITEILGPQEPPNDSRIFNCRQSDGTFRPISEFFDLAAWEYLDPLERAQLQATRPDLFQEGEENGRD